MKSNVKNSIDSAIGKVFKSYRKKYHLTQTQVADKLGISEKYISRLEKKIISRLKKEINKMI